MSRNKQYLALDIGEKRIGVALADDGVRIPITLTTIDMNDETFRKDIAHLVTTHNIDVIVIGYPRNQSGEATAQTAYVEAKAAELSDLDAMVEFQDESLTSVLAEQRLAARGEPYEKGAVDAEAATIILEDYLEAR